jgi:hypothetical protein
MFVSTINLNEQNDMYVFFDNGRAHCMDKEFIISVVCNDDLFNSLGGIQTYFVKFFFDDFLDKSQNKVLKGEYDTRNVEKTLKSFFSLDEKLRDSSASNIISEKISSAKENLMSLVDRAPIYKFKKAYAYMHTFMYGNNEQIDVLQRDIDLIVSRFKDYLIEMINNPKIKISDGTSKYMIDYMLNDGHVELDEMILRGDDEHQYDKDDYNF